MKYIKLFESFDDSEYWEIERDEYNDINKHIPIMIPDENINTIKNNLYELGDFKIEVEVREIVENQYNVIFVQSGSTHIDISALMDDYFIVELYHNGDTRYYICDDMDGLFELIRDKMKTNEGYNKPKKGSKKRWSVKYKKTIDCDNPKGFSQKQYCKRKKRGGKYKKDTK